MKETISQTIKFSLQKLLLTSETINIYIQWDRSLYGTSEGGRLFWACSVMFIHSTPLVCLLHLTVNQTLNIFIMIIKNMFQFLLETAHPLMSDQVTPVHAHILFMWSCDSVQQCMAQVPNTDLSFPLESMGCTRPSASNKKLNMATHLRCFDVLGQSVPWKGPSSKNQPLLGLLPYCNNDKRLNRFSNKNRWRHLNRSIMYFSKFNKLRYLFLFGVNQA